jgi:actin
LSDEQRSYELPDSK